MSMSPRLIDSVLFDVRMVFRRLGRESAFSITSIATLAITLALNTSVFTVMDAMLFRGLPMAKDSTRLAYLNMRKPSDLPCCPGPVRLDDFQTWRAESTAFADLAFAADEPALLREGAERPRDVVVSGRSSNTFAMLGVQPILGRDFLASDERPGSPTVVIISYKFWTQQFEQTPEVVGTNVLINAQPATIIGVMPEHFSIVYEQDLWMPLVHRPGLEGSVIGRLRDGARVEEAQQQLETITSRLQSADPGTVRGAPIVHTYSQAFVAPDASRIYRSLWIGACFVVLIACANLANLSLVRTTGRWRELTTRLALGEGQARMARQMLIESSTITSIAAVCAWWLTKWSVGSWATATASRYLALDYRVDGDVLACLVAVSMITAVVIPAVSIARVMRLSLFGALKSDARGISQGTRGKRLTETLVAVQVAFAIVLLSGAGVLVRSFENIVRADTGVRGAEHVMIGSVRLPSDKYPSAMARVAFFDRLKQQLGSTTGADTVSFSNTFPTRVTNRRAIEIDGRQTPAQDDEDFVQVLTVAPGYFRVLGRPDVSGRDFDDRDDTTSPPVVIVNRSAAERFWPGQDPVGTRLRLKEASGQGAWRTVIGVAPNIMQGDATRQNFRPVIYVAFRQQPGGVRAFVFVRSALAPDDLAQGVLSQVRSLDPDAETEDFGSLKAAFNFDRDFMDLEHADLGKHSAIAPVFAAIAVLLASVGLVAVISHTVTQRTKEIGVRIAIGATSQDILSMIMREGLRPVAAGLIVGLLASIGANRVLQSQLVGVLSYDPMTLAAGAVLLTVVALIGSQIPARRAVRIDPAVVLRNE